MHLCVLGSGSSGNCTLIGSGSACILVDAGLSGRETERRLGLVGTPLQHIKAVCISHEHADHTSGARVLQTRHKIPLYANSGTVQALSQDEKLKSLPWNVFNNGTPFWVDDLCIEPFSVPHDAYDPVGFVIKSGDTKIGVVTDMGVPTSLIRERLRECSALVIEANHDERLLTESQRPWHLKQRIKGRQGHLSNEAAAEMVTELASTRLKQVFLAHLSAECNREELAVKTIQKALERAGHTHVKVSLSYPDRISEIWTSCG